MIVLPTHLGHEELNAGAGQNGVQKLELAVGEQEALVELVQIQVAQDPPPDGARIDAQNLGQDRRVSPRSEEGHNACRVLHAAA